VYCRDIFSLASEVGRLEYREVEQWYHGGVDQGCDEEVCGDTECVSHYAGKNLAKERHVSKRFSAITSQDLPNLRSRIEHQIPNGN
jgi:hypothetical protein